MDFLKLVLISLIIIAVGLKTTDLAHHLAKINAASGGIYFKTWFASIVVWIALGIVERYVGKRKITQIAKGAAVLASYASMLQMNLQSLINTTLFNFGIYTVLTGIGVTITMALNIAQDRGRRQKVPGLTWLFIALNVAIIISAMYGLLQHENKVPAITKAYIIMAAIISPAVITGWPRSLAKAIQKWSACVDADPRRDAGTGVIGTLILPSVLYPTIKMGFLITPQGLTILAMFVYSVWKAVHEIRECTTFEPSPVTDTGRHIAETVERAYEEVK